MDRAVSSFSLAPPEAPPRGHAADFFRPGSTLFYAQRGAYGIRGRGNGGMVQVEDLDAGRVRFASAGYIVRTAQGVGFTGALNGACARDGATITFCALAQRPADSGEEWIVPARGRLRVRYEVRLTEAAAC